MGVYPLRGRVSLRLQYALWLLVALRLLVPVHLGASALSALSLLDRANGLPAVQALQDAGRRALPAQPFTDADTPAAQGGAQGADGSAPAGEAQFLADGPTAAAAASSAARIVWLAGAAAMAGWFLAINLRFRRRLRRSAAPVEAPDCPLPVYVSEAAPPPACAASCGPPSI